MLIGIFAEAARMSNVWSAPSTLLCLLAAFWCCGACAAIVPAPARP